jgi:dolichol-phosphate mannosyltransferase
MRDIIKSASQKRRFEFEVKLKETMSIIIASMPAYNEEEHIAKVVLGGEKHVDKVVAVDDASEDMTAEIAEALGAMVVRHEENRGYGAAIRTSFETAKELDADIMVIS